MQVDPVELPAPPWLHRGSRSPTTVLGCLLFGAFGIFMAVLAIRAVVDGRWLYLGFYVPMVVTCASPLYLWIVRGVDRDVATVQPFVAEMDSGVLNIERGRTATAGFLVFVGVFAFDAAIFVVGVWTGALDLDLSTGQRVVFPVAVSVLGLLALWSFFGVATRGSSGSLRLSPSAIDHFEHGIVHHTIKWSELDRITMIPQSRPGRPSSPTASRAWLIPTNRNRRPISISLNWPLGNRTAYWLINFYATHPELRDELGDQRVLDRIHAGRIV